VQQPALDRGGAAQPEAADRGPTAGSGRGAAVRASRPGRSRPSHGSPVREGRRLALLPAPAPPATPGWPCWSWNGEAPSCLSPPPELARNRWTGEQRGTGTREELGPPSPRSAPAVVDPWALVCQARRGVTAINRGNSSCRWGGVSFAWWPARSPVGGRSTGGSRGVRPTERSDAGWRREGQDTSSRSVGARRPELGIQRTNNVLDCGRRRAASGRRYSTSPGR
jgi:hypothetical protein